MKLLKNNKGQMRVIEAMMASFIILIAVAFVNFFNVTPASSTYETGELEKLGHNVLHDLDEQGLLARFVCSGSPEWENFTLALRVALPPDVYFNVTVYDSSGSVISTPPISYGDPKVFTSSSTVASVIYALPGYRGNYNLRTLVLKLVRG